jgi:putative endonuclease
MEQPFFVYILRCSDDTLYTGITNNLDRRLHEHNNTSRGARYTRGRRPVRCIRSFIRSTRSEAQRLEAHLKSLSAKEKLAYKDVQ